MKYRLISMVCLLAILTSHVSVAGEFNQVLSIGDVAPQWNDLPGVDGTSHSLADLKDSKAVVVVFTCNSCPYAVDVEDRLIALNKKYSEKGVSLVAVNVNQVDDDRLPAMKQKAEEKKFEFAYLFDETQQIAKDFGAKYTPEFFVLDGERRIAYMGAMDDSPDGKNVTKSYVEAAIGSVLVGGKSAVTETVPIGCRVRMERERRSR